VWRRRPALAAGQRSREKALEPQQVTSTFSDSFEVHAIPAEAHPRIARHQSLRVHRNRASGYLLALLFEYSSGASPAYRKTANSRASQCYSYASGCPFSWQCPQTILTEHVLVKLVLTAVTMALTVLAGKRY
jgi:hypothetical protein